MFTIFKIILKLEIPLQKSTSGQDFVMINSIVTKLNSQLPDATPASIHRIKNVQEKLI
jgi:hypothetical protein